MSPAYFFCLTAILFGKCLTLRTIDPPCNGLGEEFRICGPKCPVSCNTLNTRICCDQECVRGCFCKDGYLLISNNSDAQRCVQLQDCPRPGFLQFEDSVVTALESAGLVAVPVLRVNGSAGEIEAMWQTVRGTAREQIDFVASGGRLTFPENVTVQIIEVELVDDNVRELDEYFRVELLDPGNGTGPLGSARVIIKDDDVRPGYIELTNDNISVSENSSTFRMFLIRRGGSDGVIRIRCRTVDLTARAQQDYVPVNQWVTFAENVTIQSVQVVIIDDNIREPPETFQFQCLGVSSDASNFRQRSPTLVALVTIIDDDTRPGYVEMDVVSITVPENVETFNVTVVRNGGTDGQIRARFRTVDGSARAGSDFISAEGEVVFNDAESRKFIPLSIIDDDVREPVERFKLELFDPVAGPGIANFRSLGARLSTTVTITDDDMKPGYIDVDSLRVTVAESVGNFNISIVRREGTDGQIQARYRTIDDTAQAGSDYVRISGDITFHDGESLKLVELNIIDDDIRESLESFKLEIFDISAAPDVINFRSIRSQFAVTIIITDDDARPGYVELSTSMITVHESIGSVNVDVTRLDGTDGIFRVRYRTVDGSATAPADYLEGSGELAFRHGETSKTITFRIIDDDLREPTENFRVELFDPTNSTDVTNFRALGRRTYTVISIIDDDSRPGLFQFKIARISVAEDIRTVKMTIIRMQGSDGEVTLQVRARGRTATEGVDYLLPVRSVTFPHGVLEKDVEVQILDDDVQEDTEELLVGLFNPTAGATLGEIVVATILILDDDGPSVLRFLRRSSSAVESNRYIEIPVIRVNNLKKRVSVRYRTEDGDARAGEDYQAVTGSLLTFRSGEHRKVIRISLLDDSRIEQRESFHVILFNPSRQAALGILSRHTVELLDNDFPGSTSNIPRLSFRLPNISVMENAGQVLIPLSLNGFFIPFTVGIRTVDVTASAGKDYERLRNSIPIRANNADISIAIRIIDDYDNEEDETFLVELFDPSPGVILSGLRIMTVTVVDDDGGRIEGRRGDITRSTSKSYSSAIHSTSECHPPLILKPCADSCPPACDNKFGKIPCSVGSGCIRGCFCPDGFVKESESSERCIKPHECPGEMPCTSCSESSQQQRRSSPVGLLL